MTLKLFNSELFAAYCKTYLLQEYEALRCTFSWVQKRIFSKQYTNYCRQQAPGGSCDNTILQRALIQFNRDILINLSQV